MPVIKSDSIDKCNPTDLIHVTQPQKMSCLWCFTFIRIYTLLMIYPPATAWHSILLCEVLLVLYPLAETKQNWVIVHEAEVLLVFCIPFLQSLILCAKLASTCVTSETCWKAWTPQMPTTEWTATPSPSSASSLMETSEVWRRSSSRFWLHQCVFFFLLSVSCMIVSAWFGHGETARCICTERNCFVVSQAASPIDC